MTLPLLLSTIFVLLALSAFFSASETALLRLSKIKVKHWIHSRSSNREAWINWLAKPQELITTILVGNTLVNILLSSLMAALAMALFKEVRKEWAQGAAGAVAFILVLIFGEIVPKIFGRRHPERVSEFSLGPLAGFSAILGKPLRLFLDLLGKLFPIFKQPTPGRISALSLDEIRTLIEDPAAIEGLTPEQKEMMRKVVELHQKPVEAIMTPWKSVDSLTLDERSLTPEKIERFIDLWVELGHTRIPVVRGEPPQVTGYVFTKDLLSCVAENRRIDAALLYRWLRPLPSMPADKKVGEILELFRFGTPIACIRDKSGFPLGIVTLEDVLEEIVGEILDEYDLEEKEAQ